MTLSVRIDSVVKQGGQVRSSNCSVFEYFHFCNSLHTCIYNIRAIPILRHSLELNSNKGGEGEC